MSFDLKLKNGDLVIKNSDIETVTGTDKLIQDLLKIATTRTGTNPYALWYGTLIDKTLIGSILPDEITLSAAQSQLQVSLQILQNLQQLQVQSQQKMTADEQLASILGIVVQRNAADPRRFDVVIRALSKAYKKIQTSFAVSNS
jgi:hypothetical protein